MNDVLYIDNSTMAAVAKCDLSALLRYAHGWTSQEESYALTCGTAVHAALEHYFKTGDAKAARQIFRHGNGDDFAGYEQWANENVPVANEAATGWAARYSYNNVRDILKTWMRRHPLEDEPYRVFPDLVEIGFSFPLTDGIHFYGRYDAIVEEKASGQLFVLDHKTTGQLSSDWAHSFRLATQISGYTWAAQQLLGKRVSGAIINGIQISKLPDPVPNKDGTIRKCREHGIGIDECRLTHAKESLAIVQRTPEQIDHWMAQAIILAKRFRKLLRDHPTLESLAQARTQGMFASACRFCDFRSFCEVGRPFDRVQQMLKYNPWKPYEPKEEK